MTLPITSHNTTSLDLAPPKAWRRILPAWMRSLIWVDAAPRYDAFLSYSWALDSQIAPVIQWVLQRFLCPWYRLRAKTIFRDLSSLPAGSNLEKELCDRLDRSTHLIVLASTAAAMSRGMSLETAYWLSRPRDGHLLIIVTEGKHQTWEDIRTHLLPKPLREGLEAEPLWINLQQRREEILSKPRNTDLRDELAEELKQVLLRLYPNTDWGQLRGEERVQRRRALRLISLTAVVFMILATAAGLFAWYAVSQQHLAESRQMAAQSQLVVSYDPATALALAISAAQRSPSEEAQTALSLVLEAPLVRHVLRHTDSVNAVVFSPDGKLVATASHDHTGRVWNAETGALISTLSGHQESVTAIALSKDGTRVITGSSDGVAKIWDSAKGSLLFTLTQDQKTDEEDDDATVDGVNSVALSPDGSRAVTTYIDGSAILWNAGSGTLVKSMGNCEDSTPGAVFSPDSRLLITWGSHCPYSLVWDATTGNVIRSVGKDNDIDEEQQGSAPMRAVNQVAFAPDSKSVFQAMWQDDSSMWPLDKEEDKLLGEGHNQIDCVAFSPNGKQMVTAASDFSLTIWDLPSLKPVQTLTGHQGAIDKLIYSADGNRLFSISRDNSVRMWSVQLPSTTLLASLRGGPSTLLDADVSPDSSKVIMTAGNNTAEIWDTERTHPTATFGGQYSIDKGLLLDNNNFLTCFDGSPCEIKEMSSGRLVATFGSSKSRRHEPRLSMDGSRLLTIEEDQIVRLWNTATGQLISQLPKMECGRDETFSKDLLRMLCVDRETYKSVTVYDLTTGKETSRLSGHAGMIYTAVFSSNGRQAVTASDDNTVKVWNVESGSPISTLTHDQLVSEAEFTPDGKGVLSYDNEGTMRFWNLKNGKVVYSRAEKLGGGYSLFSSDQGRWLRISDDALTHKASLIDPNSGRVIAKLEVPNDYIKAASFSADGSHILIAASRIALVWNAENGALIQRFTGHLNHVWDARFSPDGQTVATGSLDGTVKLWSVTNGHLLVTYRPGEQAHQVVFSKDGSRLLVFGNRKANVYAANLPELLQLAIALSPRQHG